MTPPPSAEKKSKTAWQASRGLGSTGRQGKPAKVPRKTQIKTMAQMFWYDLIRNNYQQMISICYENPFLVISCHVISNNLKLHVASGPKVYHHWGRKFITMAYPMSVHDRQIHSESCLHGPGYVRQPRLPKPYQNCAIEFLI